MDGKIVKLYKNGNAIIEITRIVKTSYHLTKKDLGDGLEWGYTDAKSQDELTHDKKWIIFQNLLNQ